MMKIARKFSFLLAVSSGIFWGTYGTFATFMGNMGLEAATASLVSPLSIAVFFFILVCLDDIRKMRVHTAVLPVLVSYGLVGAVFNYSLIKAYGSLPFGIVSTIIFCNLFLLMILSYFIFKDTLTWRKGLAALLAVTGVAMVLNVFGLDLSLSLIGILWTLAAMTAWALMVTCEKYMLLHDVDGNVIMTYNGFFPVLFISIFSPPWHSFANFGESMAATNGLVLLPTLGLALITSVACYFTYINALKHLEPAYAQMGFIMDPTTASILGFLVFGQALRPVQIAGIALVLLVVIWVQWGERNRE